MTTDKTTSHSTKLANYASQVAGYKTIVSTQLATPVFAGIDVGAEELFLVIRKNAVSMKAQAFTNTPAERQRLVKRLSHFPGVTVCLEATGVYYLDLALALADAGVRLMVLNPKASHNFAKVLLRNSKTDAVDADTLAQYVERMPYQPWARPANEALALRAFARFQPGDTQGGAARFEACYRPDGKADTAPLCGSKKIRPGASHARSPLRLAAHGQGHRRCQRHRAVGRVDVIARWAEPQAMGPVCRA